MKHITFFHRKITIFTVVRRYLSGDPFQLYSTQGFFRDILLFSYIFSQTYLMFKRGDTLIEYPLFMFVSVQSYYMCLSAKTVY